MFRLSHVSFGYGDTVLLHDVTVQSPANRITVIMGDNGCGKSTLANLCMGILHGYQGAIFQREQNISARKTHQIAQSVYYLMQHPVRQLFCESVIEELCFAFSFPKIITENNAENNNVMLNDIANNAITQWQLQELAQVHPLSLSGGEVQRLALAVGCVLSRDFLLLDEPTSNLDHTAIACLTEHLRARASNGYGALVITHDAAFAVSIADDMYYLQEGRLIHAI